MESHCMRLGCTCIARSVFDVYYIISAFDMLRGCRYTQVPSETNLVNDKHDAKQTGTIK